MTFGQCTNWCDEHSASVVCLDSQPENEFIKNTTSTPSMWHSITSCNLAISWTGGSPPAYPISCGKINISSAVFESASCDLLLACTCEADMPKESGMWYSIDEPLFKLAQVTAPLLDDGTFHAVRIFFTVVLAICMFITNFGLLVLFLNRNYYPIKGRVGWTVLMCTSWQGLMILFILHIHGTFHSSQTFVYSELIALMLLVVCLGAHLMRSVKLLFSANIAADARTSFVGDGTGRRSQSWFLRKRYLMSAQSVAVGFTSICVIFLCLGLYAVVENHPRVVYVLVIGLVAFVGVCKVICLVLLSKHNEDNFNLKREQFQSDGCLLMTGLLAFIGMFLSGWSCNILLFLALLLQCAGYLIISVAIPLSLVELSETSCSIETLTGILKTQAGVEAFFDFLSKEYCQEGLMFWKELTLFEREVKFGALSDTEINTKAEDIYSTYIAQGSLWELNIQSATRQTCRERLNKINATEDPDTVRSRVKRTQDEQRDSEDEDEKKNEHIAVFGASLTEVMAVLSLHSFPRFIKTEAYRKLENMLHLNRSNSISKKAVSILSQLRGYRPSFSSGSKPPQVSVSVAASPGYASSHAGRRACRPSLSVGSSVGAASPGAVCQSVRASNAISPTNLMGASAKVAPLPLGTQRLRPYNSNAGPSSPNSSGPRMLPRIVDNTAVAVRTGTAGTAVVVVVAREGSPHVSSRKDPAPPIVLS